MERTWNYLTLEKAFELYGLDFLMLHLYVSNVVNPDAYTHLWFDIFRGLRRELIYSLDSTLLTF